MVDRRLGQLFEDFVADLFRAEGFRVDVQPVHRDARPDLVIHSSTGATAAVEAKLYRSRMTPIAVLQQAAARTEAYRRAVEANKAILVVGNKVSDLGKATLSQQYPDLIVYDADALAFLVAKHPSLVGLFEDLTRQAATFSEPVEPTPQQADIQADLTREVSATPPPFIEEEHKGRELCREIRLIKFGRAHAKKFEDKVMEALRYIFEKDLTAWSAQKATDTKLSIYDLVARVASEHDFWNAIVHQFRSRYIIFEFKNHAGKIKQGQIYTTEKYLFGTALRSTAIIISRSGADKNALAAARGALRESGKLMINLSMDDLCSMLNLKDNGDDHNTVLMERVDEMLMKLER
jgi:Restriction endonuclease